MTTETLTEPSNEVITTGAPNTVPVDGSKQLKDELAAVTGELLKVKASKKREDKQFNDRIKELEERIEALIAEIEAGGTQLRMHFGTTDPKPAADFAAPGEDEDADDEDLEDSDDEEAGDDDDSDD